MGVDKIVQLVGVLVALVAGVMDGFAYSALVIAVLGIAGGWFIAAEDRNRLLVAAIALSMFSGALGSIPGVGSYISDALGGLVGLFGAAAVTVIVLGVVDKLKP
ncbi:MAG: hypothetical protein OER22_10035 [Gammaproteobacteria bacterium]|nr:hypothetical protein [Gammaproteobacteria bacterium]MDH3408294.1 hypothetical protein [Gammaproteobacteria bacterium]MDH3552939.1 hypothetical protein [Gammaproteobacteria bacterium]